MANPAAAAFQAALRTIRAQSSHVQHDDPTSIMNAYLDQIRNACHTFANASTPPKDANQRPRVVRKLVSFATNQAKHAYANATENSENTVVNGFVTHHCTHDAAQGLPNCVGPQIAIVTQRIGNSFQHSDQWHAAVVVKIEGVLLVYDPDFANNGLRDNPNPRKTELRGLATVKRMAEGSDWKNLKWMVSGGHTLDTEAKCVAESIAAVTHAVELIMNAPAVPRPDDFARN